jgi:hypothetical protein
MTRLSRPEIVRYFHSPLADPVDRSIDFPEYTRGPPWPETVLSAPTTQLPRPVVPPDTAGSSNGTPSVHTIGQRRPESIVSSTRQAVTSSAIRKSVGPGKARGLRSAFDSECSREFPLLKEC